MANPSAAGSAVSDSLDSLIVAQLLETGRRARFDMNALPPDYAHALAGALTGDASSKSRDTLHSLAITPLERRRLSTALLSALAPSAERTIETLALLGDDPAARLTAAERAQLASPELRAQLDAAIDDSRLFASFDPALLGAAVRAAAALTDRAGRVHMRRLLDDPDPRLGALVAAALLPYGLADDRLLDTLFLSNILGAVRREYRSAPDFRRTIHDYAVRALDSGERHRARASLRFFSSVDWRHEGLIVSLLRLWRLRHAPTQVGVLHAFARLDIADDRVIAIASAALDDSVSDGLANAAASTLARMTRLRPEAAPALARALNDPRPGVRIAALKACATLKPLPPIVRDALPTTPDSTPERFLALDLLRGETPGDTTQTEALGDLLAHNPDSFDTLLRLGWRSDNIYPPRVFELALSRLDEADLNIRQHALDVALSQAQLEPAYAHRLLDRLLNGPTLGAPGEKALHQLAAQNWRILDSPTQSTAVALRTDQLENGARPAWLAPPTPARTDADQAWIERLRHDGFDDVLIERFFALRPVAA